MNSTPATPDLSNPFPGLRCFLSEEDYLFFGRHEQIEDLLRRLRTNRLVAVVGTSGSGKSSLVRAGLLPAVLGGGMAQAGSAWEIAVMRPGGSPMAHLAHALCEAGLYDADAEDAVFHLQATLSRSRNGLIEAVRQSGAAAGSRLLLVVDQFEELFRFNRAGTSGQEEAIAFVNLLLHATQQADQHVYVVLTMRSDFLGECSQFLGLAEAVNDGEFLIPRMTRDQIQEAIEGPILVRGAQIAPRLLFRLLNDVQDDQDQLPVLQHALLRTWDLWRLSQGRGVSALDLEHYQAIGGMNEALSRHADEIFDAFPSDSHRTAAARIFKALTERGPDGRGIRRPTRVGRLEAIAAVEGPIIHGVIEAYRAPGVTFLMPPVSSALGDQSVIDISHESLMRVWRRLRGWVEEEAQSARIYRRLQESAALHGEKRAGLYHDPDLQIALSWREASEPNSAWAGQYGGGFAEATAFLDTSREAAEREANERETARQRELEQARIVAQAERARAETETRAARRLRALLAGTALIALFAAGASVVAFNFWRDAVRAKLAAQKSEQSANENALSAERAAERASAQEAAAKEARQEAEVRAYTASLAAAAADLQRNDSRTLRRRLEQAPERMRGWEWAYLWNESDRSLETPIELPLEKEGYQMDLSGDGKFVATRPQGGHDKPITIYETHSGANVAMLQTYSSAAPIMTFSTDNRLLAYSHLGTNGVQIYEIKTGRSLVPNPWTYFSFLGFDPSGERAVLLDDKGKVRVFKTADWSRVSELPGEFDPGDARLQGAVSSDGKLFALGGFGASPIRIFDLSSGKCLKEIPESATAKAVQFSDTSDSLTAMSTDGVIVTYSAPNWQKVAETREGRQRRGGLALHRLDGRLLRLSFNTDGTVVVFDEDLTISGTLRGHGAPGSSIAVDLESAQIVTAHRDGVVCRWDLRHPRELRMVSRAVAFTPDGATAYAGLLALASDGARQLCAVDATSDTTLGFLRWYPWSVNHSSGATQMAYSPDGRRIAVSTSSGWMQGRWRIYDLWTGLADHDETYVDGDLECIDWSADGRWVAVGGGVEPANKEGRVRIFDAVKYQQMAEIDDHAGVVHAVSFSHDSRRLVTAAEDGRLRVWEVPGGKLLTTIGKQGDPALNCLVYSPDGDLVIVGSGDGTVAAWNPLDGRELFRQKAHGAAVTCLKFTPDGSRLVTASADRSLKIFDSVAWRELLTLHLEAPARAMSFSPDGRRLALATNSLVFLDTESEKARSSQRRLAREYSERAKPLVKSVLEKTADPIQARELIVSATSTDDIARNAALTELRKSLDSRWGEPYRYEKLDEMVTLQIFRQQLALQAKQRASDSLKSELIGGLGKLTNLGAIERQALAEFASAKLNWDTPDSSELVWEIASNRKRSSDDQILAYFGMGPIARQTPQDPDCQKTMALAEYRVGQYADALESARRGAALSQNASASAAHCLAVIAMSQHQMGQTAAAVETMGKLDELMKRPPQSTDQQAIALFDEARGVIAKPIDKPWNEQAAWGSCKVRLKPLVDEAKFAIWQDWSSVRIGRRHFDRGEHDQAKAAWEKALSRFEARLAKSPDDVNLAESLADFLLGGLAPMPESKQRKEKRIDTTKVTDSWAKLAGAYALNGRTDLASRAYGKALERVDGYEAKKPILELAARFDELLPAVEKRQTDDTQFRLALARSLARRGQERLAEKQPSDAQRELEKSREIFMRLRAGLSVGAKWNVLTPVEMKTDTGATLELQNDGSVYVRQPVKTGTYSLVLPTELKGITGMRLETLADPRLPNGGPGLATSGNFVLTKLSLEAAPAPSTDPPRPIALRNPSADFIQPALNFRGIADGDKSVDRDKPSGWAIGPEIGKDHVAVFATADKVGDGQATRLTVRLGHQYAGLLIGRFRLSVTNDAATLQSTRIRYDLKESEIVDVCAALAKARAQQGQIKEAVAAFNEAFDLAIDRSMSANLIAQAASLGGVLDKLTERAADNARFQAELARYFAQQGNAVLAHATCTKACALIEGRLAKEPENSALAAELAEVLLIDATPWTVLKPTKLKSEGGATLTQQDDGSILASGVNTDNDIYKITAVGNLDRIAAVRLEALPDRRLPSNGPGRQVSGNFTLRAFRLYHSSGDGENELKPLPVGRAWASFQSKASNVDIAGTVDDSLKKIWTTWGRGGEPHQAVFLLKERVASKDRHFVIELHNLSNLGRFRLSVCGDPASVGKEEKRFAVLQVADPWAKLAVAYHIVGKESALAGLLKRHPSAAAGLGDLYANLQDWERAIGEFRKVSTDQPAELSKLARSYQAAGSGALLRNKVAFATHFYAEALINDPKLGDDRQVQLRYDAACAAALAAAGQGKDEPTLDDAARAKLRRQALDWLNAELTALGKLLDSGPPQVRPNVVRDLTHWKQDTDLTGIRDKAALAKLPADERTAFTQLWADAAALLKRAEEKPK